MIIEKFDQIAVEDSYSFKFLLKDKKMETEENQIIVAKCLILLDSFRRKKYSSYNRVIRNQLISIAENLNIKLNQHQSNISIFNKIVSRLSGCKNKMENYNLKLVIEDFEVLESDSISFSLSVFQDYKNKELLEFRDSDRILPPDEILNFKGEISNIEVKITDPISLKSQIVIAK